MKKDQKDAKTGAVVKSPCQIMYNKTLFSLYATILIKQISAFLYMASFDLYIHKEGT